MRRGRPGSVINLSLEGIEQTHRDLLQLMDQMDDLMVVREINLSIRQQLPEGLQVHLQRVGIPLIKGSSTDPGPCV